MTDRYRAIRQTYGRPNGEPDEFEILDTGDDDTKPRIIARGVLAHCGDSALKSWADAQQSA